MVIPADALCHVGGVPHGVGDSLSQAVDTAGEVTGTGLALVAGTAGLIAGDLGQGHLGNEAVLEPDHIAAVGGQCGCLHVSMVDNWSFIVK